MTISNAIPVQFWLNGVETFNEKAICGVEPVCFCQPFNCSDVIRIQFQHTTGIDISLVAKSKIGAFTLIGEIPEVSNGIYQITVIPTNYGLCDYEYQFIICETADILLFDPSAWTHDPSSTSTFSSKTTTQFIKTGLNNTINDISDYIPFAISDQVTFSYQVTLSGAWGGVNDLNALIIEFLLTDASGNSVCSSSITNAQKIFDNSTLDNGTHDITVTLTPSSTSARLYIKVIEQIIAGFADLTITMNGIPYGVSDYLAQSDCLDIKTSHDCTVLLEYTNATDFDGIVYLTSPASEFSLRIPAQFWKEENPMEQEDSELSNGVIKTRRQSIQEKTLLEIGYVPNYMHKKIQKALMHDTLTIEGSQWKKRDAYESENINRYPLKKANVWLTLYNSIEDNIL